MGLPYDYRLGKLDGFPGNGRFGEDEKPKCGILSGFMREV